MQRERQAGFDAGPGGIHEGRAFGALVIVGAGVLYMLGTGTVKGFAYTLFWGTAFSLFTATFVTRFFMDVVVDNDLVENPKAYGA